MAGWDDVPDASAKPAPTAKGWDAVPDVKAPALDFQPTKYGFSVKDAVTPDTGKPTKQSKEGYLWYGPEQGNPNPQGGWFNDKGQQVQPAKDATTTPSRSAGPMLRMAGNQTFGTQLSPTMGLVHAGLQYLTGGGGTNPTNAGVVEGLANDVIAPAQLVNHALPGAPNVMDRVADSSRQYFANNFAPSESGKIAGSAIPMLMTGGAAGAADKASKIRQILQNYAAPTAIPVALTPETNVQSEGDYWKRKAIEGGVGLATAGTVQGLYQAAPVIRGVAGRWMAGKFNPDKAATFLADAEALGVKPRPSTVIAASQDQAREAQQFGQAVKNLSNKFKQDMLDTPFQGLAEIEAAAQGTGKRSGAATDLLEYAKNSGLDPHDVLKTSAKIRTLQEKMRLDKLALVRDQFGEQVQNADVSPVVKAIDEGIGKLKLDSRGESKALVDELVAWRDRLTGSGAGDHLGMAPATRAPIVQRGGLPAAAPAAQDSLGMVNTGRAPLVGGSPAVEEIRDAYGTIIRPAQPATPGFVSGPSPVPTPVAPNTATATTEAGPFFGAQTGLNPRSFQSLSTTRSNLSQDISALYKGQNTVTGKAPAHVLQPIKDALDTTIERAAQESGIPELAQADKVFRSEYGKFKANMGDPAVRAAVDSQNPDDFVKAIAGMGEHKAQRVFDSLEPRGQKAFLAGVWDEAVKGIENKRTGDIIPGNISGGIFDKLKALGVATEGKNAQLVAGMHNLAMGLAKSDPKLASALGQRFVEGAMGEVGPKGAMVASFLKKVRDHGVDWMFDNPAGMAFLFKGGDLKPNSTAFANLVKSDAPRIMALEATPTNITPLRPSAPAAAGESNPTVAQETPR